MYDKLEELREKIRKMCIRDSSKYEETMLTVDAKPDGELVKPDTLYIEGDGLYISRVRCV